MCLGGSERGRHRGVQADTPLGCKIVVRLAHIEVIGRAANIYRCDLHRFSERHFTRMQIGYTLICSWLFRSSQCTSRGVANQDIFFQALGKKVRELRKGREMSQEDMLLFGFSTRHWQQVEAGRPITVTTLLRICEVFETTVASLVEGLDEGIYDPLPPEITCEAGGVPGSSSRGHLPTEPAA